MKFILMVHHKEDQVAKLPPDEVMRVVNGHAEYSAALEKAGLKVLQGFRLRPGAEMVRITQSGGAKGNRNVFDGPHTESKEVVGGYYVRNRAIDALRAHARAHARARELHAYVRADTATYELDDDAMPAFTDDRLRLIFTCCHPALSVDSAIALTLRLVAGLTTQEIARAFLTTEPTIAQRLVRAKRTLRDHEVRYEVPAPGELADRLPAVLRILYLIFNEGYLASVGDDLASSDLAREATRLARCLVELMPNELEARGLHALMLLQLARLPARTDSSGGLVLLEHQDRARWDHGAIEQALDELRAIAASPQPRGPYAIEAAIAACHDIAPSWAATDWQTIAMLYRELELITHSPVTTLNRAIATSFVDGPAAALALLESIAHELADYHLWHATYGDLLRRLGDFGRAAAAFDRAASLTANGREQTFLAARASDCWRRAND